MLRRGLLAAAGGAALCAGHGSMCMPPSWLDRDGSLGCDGGASSPWQQRHEIAGCTIKCEPYSPGCKTGPGAGQAPGQIETYEGCVSEWYTNYTFIPGKVTIPEGSPLLTTQPYVDPKTGQSYDWRPTNPWRAPGSAPVHSPCGVDGGNPTGCPPGNPSDAYGVCGAGGYSHGPDGRTLPGNTKPTQWKVGAVEEVAWGIAANHGGGYQYRLCPKPKNSMDLTEECFQKMPLPFVGDTQWARFNINGSRIPMPAVRTSKGTVPAGSQWTRVPFPGCLNPDNPTTLGVDGVCTKGTQFPSPFPGAFGFVSTFYPENFPIICPGAPGCKQYGLSVKRLPEVAILDKVQVPTDIPPGDYVISFRYDCEQTSQVWNQCGDIHISA